MRQYRIGTNVQVSFENECLQAVGDQNRLPAQLLRCQTLDFLVGQPGKSKRKRSKLHVADERIVFGDGHVGEFCARPEELVVAPRLVGQITSYPG